MDKTVKKEWVAALRSGRYNQGINFLRKNDGFCCLGVLADIKGKLTIQKQKIDSENSRICGVVVWEDYVYISSLPHDFRDEVQLSDGDHSTLIEMNDFGKSFKEIADWIEENL